MSILLHVGGDGRLGSVESLIARHHFDSSFLNSGEIDAAALAELDVRRDVVRMGFSMTGPHEVARTMQLRLMPIAVEFSPRGRLLFMNVYQAHYYLPTAFLDDIRR